MNDKIVIANWKMNPRGRKEAEELARAGDLEGLVVCPPFVFLEDVSRIISRARLGAQDVFWEEIGAYTGEISPPELQDLCVEYVIVGHSERRQNLGETDEMVARKIAAALKAGLIPILCVGETREEHDGGKTETVVKRELEIGLSLANQESGIRNQEIIIAYEPIWAIGTGTPDTPENMIEMVKFIRKILLANACLPAGRANALNPRIIYGGSVTAKNAEEFLRHKEIEGALVGGASLKPEEIKNIVKISKKHFQ